jgi:enoyl-CoA hydratase/carnithine racemase
MNQRQSNRPLRLKNSGVVKGLPMAEIDITRDGRILHLIINRPNKKNALTSAMYAALRDALAAARIDPEVRVILISGAGETFCAGNDLNDFLNAPSNPDVEQPVQGFLREISSCEKIIVAAVQGAAVGVGTTMLLHCDLVVAADNTIFKTPFADLGLVPEAASSLLLPRVLGQQRAAAMFLLGEALTAQVAYAAGLVAFLKTRDTFFDTACDIAKSLVHKAPNALRLTKQLMKSESVSVAGRMAEENASFGHQLQSNELREAVGAFFEKRAANFG